MTAPGRSPWEKRRPSTGPAADSQAPATRQETGVVRAGDIPVAEPQPVSAVGAVRDAKPSTREPRHFEAGEPTTLVVRGAPAGKPVAASDDAVKTQAMRGKPKVMRSTFHQDPVVGWLVVVGGPGLGAFRPIHEGNNSVGRGKTQRIPIDFGDDTISSEEQAYIRYDSMDRSFLFVPNLSKTNIVAINDKKPTGAVSWSSWM